MSTLPEGRLTLPSGAIKSLSEINADVLLDMGALPQAGGAKIVREKHLMDVAAGAEAGRQGLAADIAALQADVDGNEADADSAIAALQADVDQNEADADASFAAAANARAAIQADVDANEASAIAAIAALQADVDANEADADAAIAALQADVDQNEADADAGIAAVASDLSTYVTANDAALAAEKLRAETEEAAIRGEMAANETARDASEAAAIQAAVNGLVAGAPGLLDTLDELAAALGDDADYHNSIATQMANAATHRGQIETDFAAADAALSAVVAQNSGSAAVALAGERTRAITAETGLQSNIDSEEAARIAADGVLTALVNTNSASFGAELSGERSAHGC